MSITGVKEPIDCSDQPPMKAPDYQENILNKRVGKSSIQNLAQLVKLYNIMSLLGKSAKNILVVEGLDHGTTFPRLLDIICNGPNMDLAGSGEISYHRGKQEYLDKVKSYFYVFKDKDFGFPIDARVK